VQTSDSEEDEEKPQKEKKKGVKKKPPKKAKLAKETSGGFDTGLDLALDEELALHLLGSKS
jgi:hypothetical protein